MKPRFLGKATGLAAILTILSSAPTNAAISVRTNNPYNLTIPKSEIQPLEQLIVQRSKKLREKAKKPGLTREERSKQYWTANELFIDFFIMPSNKEEVKNNHSFWREYTELMLDAGLKKDALQLAEKLMLREPQNPDNNLLLGRVYAELDDHKNAITFYQKALALNITSPEQVAYRLAYSLSVTNQHEQASKLIDQYIRTNPDFHKLYFLKGWLFEQKGLYDDAIQQYVKATTLNDEDLQPRIFLCDAYEHQKDYPNAITCFKKRLELTPDNSYVSEKLKELETKPN